MLKQTPKPNKSRRVVELKRNRGREGGQAREDKKDLDRGMERGTLGKTMSHGMDHGTVVDGGAMADQAEQDG